MSITPSFGYYYDWDDMNQHGVVNPGMIFASNFGGGAFIHPRYGTTIPLNITQVPTGGVDVIGPKGEVLQIRATERRNFIKP